MVSRREGRARVLPDGRAPAFQRGTAFHRSSPAKRHMPAPGHFHLASQLVMVKMRDHSLTACTWVSA